MVPPSGSIFNSCWKSTSLPLARILLARLVAASNSAWLELGIPQRTIASSRPASVLRTIGAMRSGQTSISGSMLPMLSTIARVAPRISSWLV